MKVPVLSIEKRVEYLEAVVGCQQQQLAELMANLLQAWAAMSCMAQAMAVVDGEEPPRKPEAIRPH